MNGRKVAAAVVAGTHSLMASSRRVMQCLPLTGTIGRHWFAKHSGEFQSLALELDAFNRRFSEHNARTESGFVALAQSLRSLYQTAQSLATLVSEQLGQVRTALQSTRIAGPDGLASAPLQDLREGLGETEDELKTLLAVADELSRVSSRVRSIEQLGLAIRTSVFGFAVESARSEDCQQSFGSFAAELRALGERISNIAEAIGEQSAGARQTQTRELAVLRPGHEKLCQLVQQLELTAGATAEAAQQMLHQAWQGLQQAEEHMRAITQQAGEAVFYLQFGDIVRQKCEHIHAALQELAVKFQSLTRKEFTAQAATADRIIAIQIHQLELIQSEVEAAHTKLSDSFRSLARVGEQLRGALNQWQAQGQRSENDSLSAFKADVQRMEELHAQGHALRLQARQSKQNAVTASHCLAGYVGQIKALNADIHLHALNAIVRTTALGQQGAILSVLSMYVDSLYRESNEVIADLVTMFESVLQQTEAANPGSLLAEAGAGEGKLRAGVERIETACHNCRAALASADTLVTQQHDALANSHRLLAFLGEYVMALAQQIQELKSLRETLAPHLVAAPITVAAAEELRSRYTMQSERDIHDQLAGLTPVTATATTNAADNFEFFAPTATPDETNERASQLNSTTPEKPVGAAASNSVATDKLGDNIELF